MKAFRKLNSEREDVGEGLFKNPRNTASGTIKMQDSSIVASRGLDCMLYGVYTKSKLFPSHFKSVEGAGNWGIKTPKESIKYIEKCESIEGIMDFINYWDTERKNLPFEIDGVVIKINDYGIQDELGFTAKSPRWAISYKFKTEAALTELIELTYQVGRTGTITPVANLGPVLLGGTTVRRASLYNADQIEKLDLHIHDWVFVEKGGEIIPKITGVDLSKRKEGSEVVKYIKECPDCNTELIRKEGESHHYCPNELGCPPQIKGRIEHFISRKSMDIDGLGAETVGSLVESKMISKSSDLYQLTYTELISLDRFAEKSVVNLLEGVKASTQIPFEKVLFAIGIRYVGETVAKKLAKFYKSMEVLQQASFEQLVEVDEIGDRIAESIIQFFENPSNKEEVDKLKAVGLQFELSEEQLKNTTDKLKGLSFVISGVFEKHSRDELKKMIENNGGKNVGSISKKTSYLLRGDNMGPSKLAKAEKLEVQMISEDDFLEMVQ